MRRFRGRLFCTALLMTSAACGSLLSFDGDDDRRSIGATSGDSSVDGTSSSSSSSGSAGGFVGVDAATTDAANVTEMDAGPVIDAAAFAADGSTPCPKCASGYCTTTNGQCDPIVFVTSQQFTGDFDPSALNGGVAAPDARCQKAATDAMLSGVYRAWIAAATSPDASLPWTHIVPFDGAYRRVDGWVVVSTFGDFQRGQKTLRSAISLDATGRAVPDGSEVWTGLDRFANATGEDCNQWVSSSAKARFGVVGGCMTCDGHWSAFGDAGPCTVARRLYCIQSNEPEAPP